MHWLCPHARTGHVDATGTIVEKRVEKDSLWVTVVAAPDLLRYIVEKGAHTQYGHIARVNCTCLGSSGGTQYGHICIVEKGACARDALTSAPERRKRTASLQGILRWTARP